MVLRLLSNEPGKGCYEVKDLIRQWFEKTRFRIGDIYCRTECPSGRRYVGGDIRLYEIRLKYNTEYTGNGRAVNMYGHERKAKFARFLRGLDWVDFNDQLNDMLDHYDISADVCSVTCVIRKKDRRRVGYREFDNPKAPWMVWEVRPGDSDFIKGRETPLLFFSNCDADVSGTYRMTPPL